MTHRTPKVVAMKSITLLLIGILSATAGVLADEGKPTSEPNVPFHISQLSPEQQELTNEISNELGWWTWSFISRFLIVEEPAAVVEGESLEVDRMVEEAFEHFDRHMNVELLFVRKVCDLPSHEMQSLTDSCQAVLKIAVRDFVLQFHERDESVTTPDEHAMVYRTPERIVLQVAECQLSAAQWETFSRELKARTAQRRRMTIHCLVARLDLDLLLSMAQREQFVKLFESRWQEAWGMSLSALTEQQNFMPELSTEDVATILNEMQKQKLVELNYSHDLNWDDEPLDLVAALDRVVTVEDDPADDARSDDGDEDETTPPMDH